MEKHSPKSKCSWTNHQGAFTERTKCRTCTAEPRIKFNSIFHSRFKDLPDKRCCTAWCCSKKQHITRESTRDPVMMSSRDHYSIFAQKHLTPSSYTIPDHWMNYYLFLKATFQNRIGVGLVNQVGVGLVVNYEVLFSRNWVDGWVIKARRWCHAINCIS